MEKTKFEYKWVTEEVNVEASGYTKALAASMLESKTTLLRRLLDESLNIPDNHEIKVDFK
jgi:hypothetical protein